MPFADAAVRSVEARRVFVAEYLRASFVSSRARAIAASPRVCAIAYALLQVVADENEKPFALAVLRLPIHFSNHEDEMDQIAGVLASPPPPSATATMRFTMPLKIRPWNGSIDSQ